MVLLSLCAFVLLLLKIAFGLEECWVGRSSTELPTVSVGEGGKEPELLFLDFLVEETVREDVEEERARLVPVARLRRGGITP